jgi:hypothetical protein
VAHLGFLKIHVKKYFFMFNFLNRRWTLPPELTGGLPFHLGDLWVVRSYLKSGHVTEADVAAPCVAELGDEGGLEMLHPQVVPRYG